MPETSPEQQPELSSPELPPIDTKTKCLFQGKLMEEMGVERGDHPAQDRWVSKYAKDASDLIDQDPKIRSLVADKERWPEAIKLIKKRLENIFSPSG